MSIPAFQNVCVAYLTNLRETHHHLLATDELSLRTTLEAFLKQAADLLDHPVQIVGEAKKIAAGKPDFTVSVNDLPIGYIEAEAYNVNLDTLTGHAKEQNDRFRANLDNFLLTNHLEFRLYVGGELVDRAMLPAPPETGRIAITSVEAERLATLFDRFLQGQLPAIRSPKDLAIHLARRTRQIHNEVLRVLTDPALPAGEIGEQYQALLDVLIPDLSAAQFADLYAQTITYGLFAARCTPSATPFSRLAAATLIPATNPFLRKLFQHIAAFELDPRIAWIADDTVQLLAQAPIADILADFSARTGKEDPIVHFYETFLAAYDPKVREMRGVYYTPEPVVSYIVRSLDHLLKTRFNKPLGLADKDTLILDPATGTGSFLFTIVKHVYDMVCRTHGTGAWTDYVHRNLLPRLFGFELLIAPYAVAHLKLGLLLQELQYTFTEQQRLGIYLTNTLEEAIKTSEVLLGKFIADEAHEAAAIKKEHPILVVLGNPPYSGNSANRSEYIQRIEPGKTYSVISTSGQTVTRKAGKQGVNLHIKTFIGKLIEDYKKIDGQPLGEQNSKMLQDDYVKFIRFAQWRIEKTGEGIISYITNHGYLDNPTFRGMRRSLMQTFNEIFVYNLHGNSRKKETAPDGGKDENVFDIQQGVAILIGIKEKGNAQPTKVHYADLWYLRENKNRVLTETDITETNWKELQVVSPFYLFIPQNASLWQEYNILYKFEDTFIKRGNGVKTNRDHLLIDIEQQVLRARISELVSDKIPEEHVKQKYNIEDGPYWNTVRERKKLQSTDWSKNIIPYLYRPFDLRWILYQPELIEIGRGGASKKIMIHLIDKENIAICVHRSILGQRYAHTTCTQYLCDMNYLDSAKGAFLAPLYLYPDETAGQTTTDTERRPNFSSTFLKALAEKLNLPQTKPHGLPQGITPENIFYYAYAVFHSPTYRARYAEFLKIDFPRLPLTSDLDLFRDLAVFGKQLVALHLLDPQAAPVLNMPFSLFPIAGNNVVEKVRYADEMQRVYINKTQYFDAMPPEVWTFHIGGYQVCDKWLKDRKSRTLTFDDIQHYQQIVVALSETIRLMAAIDERIPGFPIQ